MMLPTTKGLSGGEKLFIKRSRYGLSQIEMSVDLGLGYQKYRSMEKDLPGVKPVYVSLGKLSVREAYMILRIRTCVSKTSLAAAIGVSVFWLQQMEQGNAPIDRLTKYWNHR